MSGGGGDPPPPASEGEVGPVLRIPSPGFLGTGEVKEAKRDWVEELGCGGDSCLLKAGFCEGFEPELASQKVSDELAESSAEKVGFLIEENGAGIARVLEVEDIGDGECLGELEVEVEEEVCSLTNDGNVAFFGVMDGSGEVVMGREESEEEQSTSIEVGEESRVELAKLVTEDVCDKIEPEVQVGNECEIASLLISSGSESVTEVDRNCCPLTVSASENREATQTEETCGKLFLSECEKLNGECCLAKGPCLNDVNGEENFFSLAACRGENVGAQKQQHVEVDIDEPTEETSDLAREVSVGDKCPSSHLEGEVGSSEQGPSNEAMSCCSTDGFASQQPPRAFTLIENCSLKPLLASDCQGSGGGAVIGLASCFSKVNSYCGESEDGEKDETPPTTVAVSRRANPKRSASLRSSLNEGKLDQLSSIKNKGRNYREQVETSALFLSKVKLLDKFKRKRSSRRLARLSVWAPVDNLIKVFEQNSGFANYSSSAIHVKNLRPKKRRTGVDRKNRLRAQNDGTIVSSATEDASTRQPTFHVEVGSSTSDCIPTSVSQIVFGISGTVECRDKLAGDRCADGVDGQIGDKDLESTLSQETSVDYVVGECPGISSQIGSEKLAETVNCRNSLDAGTSPDSNVYNPILDVSLMTSEDATSADHVIGTLDVHVMPSEGATSTDQVIGMGESVLIVEPVAESGMQSAASNSSKPLAIPLSVPPIDTKLQSDHRRGENNGEISVQSCLISEHFAIEENFHGPENLNKAGKISRNRKSKQKRNVSNENSRLCSKLDKTLRKELKCKSLSVKPSVGIAELEYPEESMVQDARVSGQDTNNSKSEEIPLSNKIKGHKLPSSSRSLGSKNRSPGTACQSKTNVHGQKKGNSQKSKNKFLTEMKGGILDVSLEASDDMSFSTGTTKLALAVSTQIDSDINAGSKVVPGDAPSSVIIPVGEQLAPKECNHSLEGQPLTPQLAWVSCDDCQKWRCISVELANVIDQTNCKWTCKDNADKAFADCTIPQEKTNVEINAELGISDEDESSSAKPSSKGAELSKSAASALASWTAIKCNVFLHRNRKNQTIDEIMVCHCKPPRDGSLGCGEQCLNRMLNIECVKGTCPCGDICSNQQFQKRKYVKMKKFHCGKKGYGLQLQEGACQGKFLIEYVGEVLDLASYEARQRYYASTGQKHFYFMTLNGGEVIDACSKGNIGRFVNHSCDPNCRTEKWMVNGEVCIGLFTIRDIKKGEEITFDYNYVRVVGAAAKRCVCGSSECRGYLGGDPLNSEVIVQGDSDDEDLEPVMDHKVSEKELNLEKAYPDVKARKKEQICILRAGPLAKCSPATPEPGICVEIKDTIGSPPADINPLDSPLTTLDRIQSEDIMSRPISEIQPLGDSKECMSSIQIEETVHKPISDIQPFEVSLKTSSRAGQVLEDSVPITKKSMTNHVVGKPNKEKPNKEKPCAYTKSSRSSGKITKGRLIVRNLVSHNSKKLATGAGNGHFDGVEEKLNELLDMDGGISKQKDATRGYLKLLFVTAAEGDVKGCAFQSTRDLSLILDAILKTKSRKVLMDIINKNGLQMLHNIMKQNRSNFNRIPIIRKLLKVLEFLALKELLTTEHINRDPPCSGMESFKESMLILTRHNDVQVHQIARNFRDKWIPRTIKRVEPLNRDANGLDPQHHYGGWFQSSSKPKCWHDQEEREATSADIAVATHPPESSAERDIPGEPSSHGRGVSSFAPVIDNSSASVTVTRKRKSRWGPPLDVPCLEPQSSQQAGVKCMKLNSAQQASQYDFSRQTSLAHGEGNSSCDEVASTSYLMQQNVNFEAPPGFELPQQNVNVEAPPGFDSLLQNVNFEAPPGFGSPPKQHDPHMHSEQISAASGQVVVGHRQERYLPHLSVSFGVPMVFIQQLGTPKTGGGSQFNPHWEVAPGVPFHPFPPLPSYPHPTQERIQSHAASCSEKTTPSTSSGLSHMPDPCYRKSRFNGRLRWPSNGPARRPFRSQGSNNWRFQRSLPYSQKEIGQRESMRDGTSNLGSGKVSRSIRGGSWPTEGVSNDSVSTNSRQQLHHN